LFVYLFSHETNRDCMRRGVLPLLIVLAHGANAVCLDPADPNPNQGTIDVSVTSGPPPALPPTLPPTIITEDKTWNLLLIAVFIPIAILLATCAFAFKMRKALRRARARAKDAQRARLLDALDTTRSLQFPGVLVQLSDVCGYGEA
jgi:hypothetical protein